MHLNRHSASTSSDVSAAAPTILQSKDQKTTAYEDNISPTITSSTVLVPASKWSCNEKNN